MANNVGNISIGLSLDNQTFEAVLNGSASRLKRFEGDIARGGLAAAAASGGVGRLSGSMGKLGSVMQSASFGAGDFISQLGTRGFGGGLQAAANNIQQLGAAFGPMGLAVSAGVGVAATALGVWWEQSDRVAKKTKAMADENAKAWSRMSADAKKGAQDWRQSTRIMMGEDRDIAQNKDRKDFDTLKSDLGSTNKQIEEMQRKRDAMVKRFNETLPEEIRGATGPGDRFAQRAGVNLPGGFRSIAEADSRTGPLFRRALGGAANTTVGKWVTERAPGLAGWLTGQTQKQFRNTRVLTPEKIDALSKLEQDIIAANDALANLERRRQAIDKGIGPAFTEKRDAQRNEQALKDAKEAERRRSELQNQGDALRQRFETEQDRYARQKMEIESARTSGAITNTEADLFQQRLMRQTQPNNLPSFSAGSSETLAAINRVIRGGREGKVIETNTKQTADQCKKIVGKLDEANKNRERINVVRFN